MSVKSIVDEALKKARTQAGGGSEKIASAADGQQDLQKEASQVADALEYLAGVVVDDGTAEGAAKRSLVDDFFKGATGGKGPATSVSPTGTQATPPQSGAKKILPEGKATGTHPAESEAPTGTQSTMGQPSGGKTASAPRTLLEVLTKEAGDPSKAPSNAPTQSVAGQDTADPGKQGQNSNVDKCLGSNEAPVNTTKRDAKLPTRARLKELFASASDTGPSSAAAKAAFPTAYARGGMKVADDGFEKKDEPKADEKCGKCEKEPCACEGEKKASVVLSASASLFDKAASGALGEEMQQFAQYVESIEI